MVIDTLICEPFWASQVQAPISTEASALPGSQVRRVKELDPMPEKPGLAIQL